MRTRLLGLLNWLASLLSCRHHWLSRRVYRLGQVWHRTCLDCGRAVPITLDLAGLPPEPRPRPEADVDRVARLVAIETAYQNELARRMAAAGLPTGETGLERMARLEEQIDCELRELLGVEKEGVRLR